MSGLRCLGLGSLYSGWAPLSQDPRLPGPSSCLVLHGLGVPWPQSRSLQALDPLALVLLFAGSGLVPSSFSVSCHRPLADSCTVLLPCFEEFSPSTLLGDFLFPFNHSHILWFSFNTNKKYEPLLPNKMFPQPVSTSHPGNKIQNTHNQNTYISISFLAQDSQI